MPFFIFIYEIERNARHTPTVCNVPFILNLAESQQWFPCLWLQGKFNCVHIQWVLWTTFSRVNLTKSCLRMHCICFRNTEHDNYSKWSPNGLVQLLRWDKFLVGNAMDWSFVCLYYSPIIVLFKWVVRVGTSFTFYKGIWVHLRKIIALWP